MPLHSNLQLIFQLQDDEFSNGALNALLKCLLTPSICCDSPDFMEPVVATCSKTEGFLGEKTNLFPTHEAINVGHLTLGQTLVAFQTTP